MNNATTTLCMLLLAGICAALRGTEPVLGPLNPADPGFTGFLGVPGSGEFFKDGPVWHRSGQIFTLEPPRAGFCPLSIWKVDSKTQRAARTMILNVGASWCVSQTGDMICAQSPRKDDEPLDPAVDQSAWLPGAFGCFRLSDGARLWKLPWVNERVAGAAFTLDDKMVAILTVWGGKMSLRLLDAKTGLVVRQHDFAGRRPDRDFKTTNLMMRADEVWMTEKEEDSTMLLRFPLATLQPEKVACPPLENFVGRVSIAPDGRHILLVGNGSATCLGLVNGKWQPVHEDHDFNPISDGSPVDGHLQSAHFMPDGRSVLLASDESARLTDLTTKKTRSINLESCIRVVPSPDGSNLLVQHENGMEVVSLRETDATDRSRHRQHVWRPHLLRFSRDGRTLYAAEAEGVWVWDVAARKPRAWLTSHDRHVSMDSLFKTMCLTGGETELLAEEHNDILRWKLPPTSTPLQEAPLIVKPTLAFGGVRSTEQGPWAYPGVFAHPEGKWFVTVNGKNIAVIHRGLGAGVSQTSQKSLPPVSPVHWFFGKDDTFTFHSEIETGWHRLDLRQGTVTEVSPLRDDPVAVLPVRQMMIMSYKEGIRACTIDGKTLLPLFEKPSRRFASIPNLRAAVSLDERRCAWVLECEVSHRQHLFVWEIDTGRMLGQAALPFNDISSTALSPDGSVAACGHANTAISLWDVARLVPLPAPPSPKVAPPAVKPLTAPAVKPPVSRMRREHLFGSGLWDIRENGTVTKGVALPEAGLLRVDAAAFTPKASRLVSAFDLNRFQRAQMNFKEESRPKPGDPRFRPVQPHEFADVAAGLIQDSEGEAGETWVSRQIGNPGGTGGAFLTFTDAITHRGSQEKEAVVEFEVRFPAHTQSWMDSKFNPVQVGPDGTLKLAPDAIWVAALPETGKSITIPIFMFRSASGSQACRLMWRTETSTLTARHPVTLKPGETRWMMHGMRVVTLKAGEVPSQFAAPSPVEFGLVTALTVSQNALNFGLPPDFESIDYIQWRLIRRRSDEFGATWREDIDRTLTNVTTTSKAHQLWLDGAPLPFSSTGAFLTRDTGRWMLEPGTGELTSVTGSSLDRTVMVTRSRSGREQPLPLIIDSFLNQSEQPVQARPAYISTFTEPVRALYNASGRPVEVGSSPVAASTLGGAIILEFSGPERPSTALVFYQDGAAAEPKLSWPCPKMLKIEYDITLPSKKSATFWHGATQRNLASFSSVAEAFTGVLPFKRNPTGASEGLMNVK